MSDPSFEAALRQELERRIAEVSAYRDEDFGRIGAGEWVLFCVVGLLLPAVAVWLAA
jgi:hypothetical protein